MGLLGKIFKKVAESAGDSKKSSNTASSAEIEKIKNRPLPKSIQKDLEELDKMTEDLSKSLDILKR